MRNRIFILIPLFLILAVVGGYVLPKYNIAKADVVSCNLTSLNGEPIYRCGGGAITCAGGSTGCASTYCDLSSQGEATRVCMPSSTWGYNCITQCGTGGGGASGPPDDDMGWVRTFSRNADGSALYWSPSEEASGLSVNSSNRRDYLFSVDATGDGVDGEIWSGKMCGRGPAAQVNANGTLSLRSNGTGPNCNMSDMVRTCTACNFDDSYCLEDNSNGCGRGAWFANSVSPSLKRMDASSGDQTFLNKLYFILNDNLSTAPSGMPRQRYDQIYTFNFKAPESDNEYRIKLTSPSSYFCYGVYGMKRYDGGAMSYGSADLANLNGSGSGLNPDSSGRRLILRPDLENPELGALDNGTKCDAEIVLEGGGAYMLFETRKSVLGKVVSMDGTTTPDGIAGVTVRLRYGSSTATTTTDSYGYYRFNEPNLYQSATYTVDVTSTAPAGHTGSAFVVNSSNYTAATNSTISYTHRSDGRDSRVGDTSYLGQSTTSEDDCSSSNVGGGVNSGRCVFGFQTAPTSYPTGSLNVVYASNKVSPGVFPYDHAVCLNSTVQYSTSVAVNSAGTVLLNPTTPFYLNTAPTGATSGTGTWSSNFGTPTLLGAPGKTMNTTGINRTYSAANGYTAGTNYYVRLVVNDNTAPTPRTCSGNPYVNYATHPSVKYCGAYNPSMTNPMTDTNASKPYKTIHVVNSAVNVPVSATDGTVRNQINVTWTYPTSTSAAYLADVVRYRVFRGSTLIATVPANGTRTGTYEDKSATCNGAAQSYRVIPDTGYYDVGGNVNACTAVAGLTDNGTCTPNRAPTCTIQYRNSSNQWVTYDDTLVWAPSTTIALRLSCTDPDTGDTFKDYSWTTNSGSFNNNQAQSPTYTVKPTDGGTDTVTASAEDNYDLRSNVDSIIIRVRPATGGTAAMIGGTVSKSSPSVPSPYAGMSVTGYVAASAGTGTINTTANGHFCGVNASAANARIGTCTWVTNGTFNSNSATTTNRITATLRTGTTPGSYGINKGGLYTIAGTWAPAAGTPTNPNPTAQIRVTDNIPTVTGLTVTKTAGTQTYVISSTATDDWSLKEMKVELLTNANVWVQDLYTSATHFTERSVAQMTNANHISGQSGVQAAAYSWNAASFTGGGVYRIRLTVEDNNGQPGSMISSDFVIDKQSPTCPSSNGMTFSPTTHNGTTSVAMTANATDAISTLRYLRVTYVGPGGGTGTIFTSGSPTSGTITSPRTGTWNTTGLARGQYTVYADWTDSQGNQTNTPGQSSCSTTYSLVNPSVSVGPSIIRVVDESSQCPANPASVNGSTGSAMNAISIDLNAPGGQQTVTPVNGQYSFPSANLVYPNSYTLNFRPNAGYALCSGFNNTQNINTSTTPGYPNTTVITASPVLYYRQEATNWWQAYNGGVHSNSSITFNYNGAGGAEGMPLGGIVIGDPTGTSAIPEGFDMFSVVAAQYAPFNSGALYSSFGIDSGPDNFGQSGRDWSVSDLGANNKPMELDIPKLFNTIEGYLGSDPTWDVEDSFETAVTDGSAYIEGSTTIGGGTPYDPPATGTIPAVFIEEDLNINGNVTMNGGRPVIVYVGRNVTIQPGVTSLDSMFIVAAGDVNFEAAPADDGDVAINILGGVYGNSIDFQRNLADAVGSAAPAERVLYNSWLISNSHLVPAEITESKVYYILTE